MRRALVVVAIGALLIQTFPHATAQSAGAVPVVFVHGMGGDASVVGTKDFADLLPAIARQHPTGDLCPKQSQRDRPWTGSPCVFRFIEDIADGGDSQSGVKANANKLARELAELHDNSGRQAVLIGYSMGGAIIRTYLALHRDDAERFVQGVVLIDAVASGSWGYAFAGELPRRVKGPLGARLDELMRSLAASASAVDFNRPATQDLTPRSALFREIAPMKLPHNISYYTFWGDIRIEIERRLLTYELPSFKLPSLGDLGLLPGDPDPTALPEFGGQRFSPSVNGSNVALDVPHQARIVLSAKVIGDLIETCGHKPADQKSSCSDLVGRQFSIPNTHTAIPASMSRQTIDEPQLGGRVSLLDAVLAAVARHA